MGVVALGDREFSRLSQFIEDQVGIRMPPVKRIMLESRLQKRLRMLSIDSFEEYVRHVFEVDPAEVVHMIDVVTTNKTDFFRESDHFTVLSERVLPEFSAVGWGHRRPLRVWSTASSTGEEPYTLAIVLSEYMRQHRGFDYRVLGTDISTRVLEIARKGIYDVERLKPVEDDLRKRYFLRSRESARELVRVRPELRRKVIYARLNLMAEQFPIHDRFEVIFCRNVIIYFERPRQMELLAKLYDFLVPGGYLFLGHSETLAGADLPFESVAPTVYRRPDSGGASHG